MKKGERERGERKVRGKERIGERVSEKGGGGVRMVGSEMGERRGERGRKR